jgi:cobalt-zinc-cadmium efflux system protein
MTASHSPHDDHGHDHDHGHGHSHAAHSHGGHRHAHGHDSERRVFGVMLLTGLFMAVEVAGGVLSGSLALLADAGHMVTDFGSLALAWAGFRLARRPSDSHRTYGWDRFQVLAAFVNGLALLAIAAWILLEAVLRMRDPVPVLAPQMIGIAAVGLLVNVVAFLLLHAGDRDNLNVQGAWLHVLSDLLGSVAAVAAGVVILLTGWTPIDPLLSVGVALLLVRGGWRVVARSGHILLEGVPDGMGVKDIAASIRDAVPAVLDVHHVHAWSLTSERPMVTLHAVIADGTDGNAAITAIEAVLRSRFGVEHATVQIEQGGCVRAVNC